jgi:hypothetical protein
MPRRLRLDAREIEVIDNLDQWHGPHDRYFEVKGDDRDLYILCLDEIRAEWELIMFQSAISDSSSGLPSKQRARWLREDVACG